MIQYVHQCLPVFTTYATQVAGVMPRVEELSMSRCKAIPLEEVKEDVQESPPELPELLKVEEVMKKFRIGRTAVYNLMKRGMPHYKLGKKQRNLRFIEAELLAWFKEQKIS
jgi:predicted DNA-binding transcriptional regulator AlpA